MKTQWRDGTRYTPVLTPSKTRRNLSSIVGVASLRCKHVPYDDEKANHRERRDGDGRSETMQNNKRPVGRADEGVIFKFNSAVPRDKRVMVPPPLCVHQPDIFYDEKQQRPVVSFLTMYSEWFFTTR